MTMQRAAGNLIEELTRIVGNDGIRHRPVDMMVFEYDGSVDGAVDSTPPVAAVFPTSTEQVADIMRVARRAGVPVVARGAGTGLSGGAVAARGGIVVSLTRMDRVLSVQPEDRTALVEPGVINLELSEGVRHHGLFFAPDPSSQRAATIGGNIAENAGGPHCLKYGVTTNHILGVEVVLSDGRVRWFDSVHDGYGGLDLTAAVVGSEGMFGIVTKARVRLTPLPESVRVMLAAFPTMADAAAAVAGIIAAGVLPAAMEMMDQLAMSAVEQAFHSGYPANAAAVLLIEVDGHPLDVDAAAADVRDVCQRSHAIQFRQASDPAEQALLWKGRKMALPTLGRLAPNYYLHDAVVPRSKLVQALDDIARLSRDAAIPIANTFHAGDGNLHPVMLFDRREHGAIERVLDATHSMIDVCVGLGGTLSGEHGIGSEKRAYMSLIYTEDDLRAMAGLRRSFDPHDLCNPGKVIPDGAMCGEVRDLHLKRAAMQHHIFPL